MPTHISISAFLGQVIEASVTLNTAPTSASLTVAGSRILALAANVRARPDGIDASTRRRVAALLLLHHASFPALAIHELTRELRMAHTRRARSLAKWSPNRAPIYQLHVSKAGGTSICLLSRYNKCLEHPEANNCWVSSMLRMTLMLAWFV
jgi:hypothetical protein